MSTAARWRRLVRTGRSEKRRDRRSAPTPAQIRSREITSQERLQSLGWDVGHGPQTLEQRLSRHLKLGRFEDLALGRLGQPAGEVETGGQACHQYAETDPQADRGYAVQGLGGRHDEDGPQRAQEYIDGEEPPQALAACPGKTMNQCTNQNHDAAQHPQSGFDCALDSARPRPGRGQGARTGTCSIPHFGPQGGGGEEGPEPEHPPGRSPMGIAEMGRAGVLGRSGREADLVGSDRCGMGRAAVFWGRRGLEAFPHFLLVSFRTVDTQSRGVRQPPPSCISASDRWEAY